MQPLFTIVERPVHVQCNGESLPLHDHSHGVVLVITPIAGSPALATGPGWISEVTWCDRNYRSPFSEVKVSKSDLVKLGVVRVLKTSHFILALVQV